MLADDGGGVARETANGPGLGRSDLVGAVDSRAQLALRGVERGAKPADDERDGFGVGERGLQLVEGDGPVGAALERVDVLVRGGDAADGTGDVGGSVDEFAGPRDERDAADLAREVVDRTEDLEGQLWDAVAESDERHVLEDDVGEAAIVGCVGSGLLGGDERIGGLGLGAGVEARRVFGEIEFGAVGPDAADAGDFAFAEGDGEIGGVGIVDAAGSVMAAFAGATGGGRARGDGFGEIARPDDLAAERGAAVEARDGCAFSGTGDAQIGEARAVGLAEAAGIAEQFLVDDVAGEGADLRADGGAGDGGAEHGKAGRQQITASSCAGSAEGEGGHFGGFQKRQ